MFTLAVLGLWAQMSDPFALFQLLAKAVMSGSVPASTLLVMIIIGLIALVRWGGPKLEAILPDHTMVDRALQWLFKSKPGGWLWNALITSSGTLATIIAANPTQALTWSLLAPVLGATFTLAGIWEFVKDLYLSWQARRAAAVAVPGTP